MDQIVSEKSSSYKERHCIMTYFDFMLLSDRKMSTENKFMSPNAFVVVVDVVVVDVVVVVSSKLVFRKR